MAFDEGVESWPFVGSGDQKYQKNLTTLTTMNTPTKKSRHPQPTRHPRPTKYPTSSAHPSFFDIVVTGSRLSISALTQVIVQRAPMLVAVR